MDERLQLGIVQEVRRAKCQVVPDVVEGRAYLIEFQLVQPGECQPVGGKLHSSGRRLGIRTRRSAGLPVDDVDAAGRGREHCVDAPTNEHTGNQQLERGFHLDRRSIRPRRGQKGRLQRGQLTVVGGVGIRRTGQLVDVEQPE